MAAVLKQNGLKHCVKRGAILLVGFLSMIRLATAMAALPPSPVLNNGMNFSNSTNTTLYLDYSYNTPADACAAPQVPGQTVSAPQQSGSGYVCQVVTPLAPKTTVSAAAALLQYSNDNQTLFSICKSATKPCGAPGGTNDPNQDGMCLSAYEVDSNGNPLLCEGYKVPPVLPTNNACPPNYYQEFDFGKYGDLNIPPDYVEQLGNGITIRSDGKCQMNLPLPRNDLQANDVPSAIVRPESYSEQAPIYDFSQAFIDNNPNFNYSSPANRPAYYVTVGGNAGAPITPLVLGINGDPSNPLNLAFEGNAATANKNYRANLFTVGSGLPNSASICPNGICQVNVCACDPGLTADDLQVNQGGLCPTGQSAPTECAPPTTNTCSNGSGYTWVDPTITKGPVGTCFQFKLQSGIYTTPLSSLPADVQITVPMLPSGGSVDLDNYFSTVEGTLSGTAYSVIANSDIVPDRNNGNSPQQKPTPNTGINWGPVVLQYGAAGIPVSPSLFTISGNQLEISSATAANLIAQAGPKAKGAIVQLTIKASLNGNDAYQTIYLNISSLNTNGQAVYSVLPKGLSAWMYAPNVPGIVNADGSCNTTATPYSSCTTSSPDYPLCDYLHSINNPTMPISEITPDIGWVQFGTLNDYIKYWDPNKGPLNNNYLTDPKRNIQCMADYFKTNAPNTAFVVTYEFDSPLKGFLPNIQQTLADESSGVSQLTTLVGNVTSGLVANKQINGLQFDIESLPNTPFFYKPVADLLARAGKINELFAFASEDNSAIIMAQGPMGIFLPSMYDVGQSTDPDYASDYYSTFGTPLITPPARPAKGCNDYPQGLGTDGSCPLSTIDYACHYDYTPAGNPLQFLIKSYCNINLNNTLYNNADLFDISNTTNSFAKKIATYGGHFRLAVPSEGSATNWTSEVIYNPRLANASGGTCNLPSSTQTTAPNVNYTPVNIPPQGTAGVTPPLLQSDTSTGTLAVTSNALLGPPDEGDDTSVSLCLQASYPRTCYTIPLSGTTQTTNVVVPSGTYTLVGTDQPNSTDNPPPETINYNGTYTVVVTPSTVTVPSGGSAIDVTLSYTNTVTPCTVPSLPSNYTPHYIQGTTDPTNIPAYKSYNVYYTGTANTSGPPCSMDNADAGGSVTMCSAVVIGANPDLEGTVTTSGGTSSTATNQYNYLYAIYNFALGLYSHFPFASGALLGSPNSQSTSYNPSNLGVAFYALSNEVVTGCAPGGSHGGGANCLDPYPIGTAYPSSASVYGGDIWALTKTYLGSLPPPPPSNYPIQINSLNASFYAAGQELLTMDYQGDINTAQTCHYVIGSNTTDGLARVAAETGGDAGVFTATVTCYSPSNAQVSNEFSDSFGVINITGLTITPSSTSASIAINVDGNSAGAVTDYLHDYRIIVPGVPPAILWSPSEGGSAQVTGLTPGTTYRAIVVALDANGNAMSNVAIQSFTTPS